MVNFYAPINSLGYGVHTYNFMRALDKSGMNLALFPMSNNMEFSDLLIEKWLNNAKAFSKDDLGVMIFHEQYMNKFYGRKRIGFPVFELDLLKEDIEKLKTLDVILQTSTYFKDYLNSLGFNNVYVVPEGYSANISKTNFEDKKELLKSRGVVFSHVGKFESRKSSLDILRVFTYALQDIGKNCILIAHMINIFEPNWLNIIKSCLETMAYRVDLETESMISFRNRNLNIIVPKGRLHDISEVYDQSHFGIYLSKAEGWNLPLIESIASGLPCITTNWTGQSEYLKNYPIELIVNKGNSVVANDGRWFFGNRGNWTEPDLSHTKEILKRVASMPEKYLELRQDCFNAIKDFTWDNSAKVFNNVLKEAGIDE